MKFNYILTIALFLFLLSCKKKEDCSEFIPLEENCWAQLGYHDSELIILKSNAGQQISFVIGKLEHYYPQPDECSNITREKYYYNIQLPDTIYSGVSNCKNPITVSIETRNKKLFPENYVSIYYFNTYLTKKINLDTVTVNGVYFNSIYKFKNHESYYPLKEFYFSKEHGVIKIVFNNNKTWERINL